VDEVWELLLLLNISMVTELGITTWTREIGNNYCSYCYLLIVLRG